MHVARAVLGVGASAMGRVDGTGNRTLVGTLTYWVNALLPSRCSGEKVPETMVPGVRTAASSSSSSSDICTMVPAKGEIGEDLVVTWVQDEGWLPDQCCAR